MDEVVKVILNPPTQPVATNQSEVADILGAGDVQDRGPPRWLQGSPGDELSTIQGTILFINLIFARA